MKKLFLDDIRTPEMIYDIHSANPVAAEQIRGLLNNYIRFLKEEGK